MPWGERASAGLAALGRNIRRACASLRSQGRLPREHATSARTGPVREDQSCRNRRARRTMKSRILSACLTGPSGSIAPAGAGGDRDSRYSAFLPDAPSAQLCLPPRLCRSSLPSRSSWLHGLRAAGRHSMGRHRLLHASAPARLMALRAVVAHHSRRLGRRLPPRRPRPAIRPLLQGPRCGHSEPGCATTSPATRRHASCTCSMKRGAIRRDGRLQ